MRKVTLDVPVRLKVTAQVDTDSPDAVVIECYVTETGASLVWLPVDARAAILRAAIVEAKDQEAAYVDIDARR